MGNGYSRGGGVGQPYGLHRDLVLVHEDDEMALHWISLHPWLRGGWSDTGIVENCSCLLEKPLVLTQPLTTPKPSPALGAAFLLPATP